MSPRALRLSAPLLLLLALWPAAAGGAWSGVVTVTSDYVFRGVSQSDGHGALQAGVDWSHPSGWFAGGWASTLEIAPSVPGGEERSLELDLYAGYRIELTGPWSADASLVRYHYPDSEPAAHYDYTEGGVGLHYRDTVSLSLAYTPDVFGQGAEAWIGDVTLRWPLPWGAHAVGGVGVYASDVPFLEEYRFWSLGVTRSLGPMVLDIIWFDTDSAAARIFRGRAGDRLVLAVGAALP